MQRRQSRRFFNKYNYSLFYHKQPRLSTPESIFPVKKSIFLSVRLQNAVFHRKNAVCALGYRHIVRDHDERLVHYFLGAQKKLKHLVGIAAVKVAGGLVRKYDLRTVYQRAGYRHALLLTARKLARQVVQAVADIKRCDQLFQVFLLAEIFLIAHKRGDKYIFKRRELGYEVVVLKNHSYIITAEDGKLVG